MGEIADSYEIEAGEFVPTFWIITEDKDGLVPTKTYNDRTKFDFYYVQTHEDERNTRYEAILCTEYINGPYFNHYTDAERENAIGQLYHPEYQLCPDVEVFELESGVEGEHSFMFVVDLIRGDLTLKEQSQILTDSSVMSTTLSRYYTPRIFADVGYMPFISINENLIDMVPLSQA